jgi:ectoine hydroxylase-related dioxygenase (phytanoyl-CoA dioxygenase family)
MLTASELDRVAYEIHTLGFSIVEDVIDVGLVSRLRKDLIETIAVDQAKWKHRPQKSEDLIVNLAIYGGAFLDLLGSPVMHQTFERFLTPTCILYNYGSTFLLPGGKPASMNIHVDSPRVIPGYDDGLIMTLALDNFTNENGATLYLPGSQNLEKTPDAATFERYATSVARPAGAAVFFKPRCFHRASANTTSEIRCGVTVYAVRAFMKQRFDFPRMIPPEAVAALPARTRKFLGFDARVPADMAEYYVDGADRLYKADQG